MYALKQYEFVQESRNVLFEYCQTIRPNDFIDQNSSFSRGGSIRNLLDRLMSEFFELMKNSNIEIEYEIKGTKNSIQPLKLFTHVITHEYHHKGQILSLSRHLGYIPADTDIIR